MEGLRHEPRAATGATPLMAARGEHPEIVRPGLTADLARRRRGLGADAHATVLTTSFLLRRVASAASRALVNAAAPAHNGMTPLHQVVMYAPAASNIVQKLLDMGADPTVPLNDGNRLPSVALGTWVTVPELNFNHTTAVAAGMTVIDMLVDAGLDIDTPGKGGVTTLRLACSLKRPRPSAFASRRHLKRCGALRSASMTVDP